MNTRHRLERHVDVVRPHEPVRLFPGVVVVTNVEVTSCGEVVAMLETVGRVVIGRAGGSGIVLNELGETLAGGAEYADVLQLQGALALASMPNAKEPTGAFGGFSYGDGTRYG